MTTRSDARGNIRKILRQYSVADTLAASLDSSATEITVNLPDIYSVGDVIGIAADDSSAEELVIVVGKPVTVSDAGNKLTISRAHAGSTAKVHASGNAIRAYPEFHDAELDVAINYAINDTFIKSRDGAYGIWVEVQDTTLSTSTAREYTVPSSITFISQIEVADDNANFQVTRKFRISGSKIVFHGAFPSTGKTIRVNGIGYQARLSDDTTAFSISDEQIEFVEFTAAWKLLEWRLPERLKSSVYSAAINERAGQPNEIMNMINYFRRRSEDIFARESRPLPNSMILIAKR